VFCSSCGFSQETSFISNLFLDYSLFIGNLTIQGVLAFLMVEIGDERIHLIADEGINSVGDRIKTLLTVNWTIRAILTITNANLTSSLPFDRDLRSLSL
jgi:hypothetical protein